jgi:glycosyltransferase involved in cell wall biosynthesis
MENPAISVVMSVYNGEKYLKASIESILIQSFPYFELIIIDDGSEDRSGEIIRFFHDPRIILIQQENKGLALALNAGIDISKGKYIARADADDVALPERLKKQYEFMEGNPQYVAVGSWANWIDTTGRYLYTMKWPVDSVELKKGLPFKVPVPHAGALYRKDAIVAIGGYKNVGRYFLMEDLLLMIDLAKKGEFTNIQESLSNFRIGLFTNTQKAKRCFKYQRGIIARYYYDDILDLVKISNINKSWYESNDKQIWAEYYLGMGKIYLERNFQRAKAVKMFIISLRYSPLNFITWFNLFLALLPEALIRKWKKSRGVDY